MEIPTSSWKVKIYQQIDGSGWIDRGTGLCVGQMSQATGSDEAFLTVRAEANLDEVILKSRVYGSTHYHKQQNSLIVWTEDEFEMALSFQEAEGCSVLCDFLVFVQNNFEPAITVLAITQPDPASDETVSELLAGPVTYPPEPTMSNLAEVLDVFSNASSSQYGREAIVKYINETDFIASLVTLFSVAEDLESLDDLHVLCQIIKIMFLMNDSTLLDSLIKEQNIMAILGMLEYDPDFPKLKANHREYLADESRFKEVVHIADTHIREKIKQTFWLQFLKDVVLARLLDDPTFSMLTSLIYFNQVEIVQYIQKHSDFTTALFGLYESQSSSSSPAEVARSPKIPTISPSPSTEDVSLGKKRDGVRFVHQMSIVAKSFLPQQQSALYTHLIKHGLFRLLDFALKDSVQSTRMLGSEIMVTIIEQEPNLVRYSDPTRHVYNESAINVFIDLINNDGDLGLKSQATEALRILLDSAASGKAELAPKLEEGADGRSLLQFVATSVTDDSFELEFYSKSAPKLFQRLLKLTAAPVLDEELSGFKQRASYEQLCDLLSFCIRQHRVPCREFVVQHNLYQGISRLIQSRYKQLQLAALRCLKQGVLSDDIYYTQSIIRTDALGSVLDVLIKLKNRNNLLHSSCLELFDAIPSKSTVVRRTARVIVTHLIANYSAKLEGLKQMGTPLALLEWYEETERSRQQSQLLSRINSGITEPDALEAVVPQEDFLDQDELGNGGFLHRNFGLVDYDEDDDIPTPTPLVEARTEGSETRLGVKRHATIAEKRQSQRRKTAEEEVEPPEKSEAVARKRRSSGTFRRTLASAGKKISVTFQRDRSKERKETKEAAADD